MIKVYQFHLNELERFRLTAQGWDSPDPKIRAYGRKSLGQVEDVNFNYYKHVANVNTNDREVAFTQMNLWDLLDDNEQMVEKLQEEVYSMSVGDIIEMEDGTRYLCASFGWEII